MNIEDKIHAFHKARFYFRLNVGILITVPLASMLLPILPRPIQITFSLFVGLSTFVYYFTLPLGLSASRKSYKLRYERYKSYRMYQIHLLLLLSLIIITLGILRDIIIHLWVY